MRVFMISYGGGHCNIMAPVYKRLVQEKNCDVVYLALTLAPVHLRRYNIKFWTINEFAKILPYYEKIKSLGDKYGLPLHHGELGINKEDTKAYYGVGMYDLIAEYGETKAENLFKIFGRKAFLPVESMRSILKKIRPDVCVVTTAPRMEKATGMAADSLGIPVVMINDMPDFLPWAYPVKFRCSLCVMNEWAKKFATDVARVPSSDIYVTGQPALEEVFHVDKVYINKVMNHLGMMRFEKVVTFFLQNGLDQSEEVEAIYNIARKMQNVMFVIKLHPSQDMHMYDNCLLDNVVVTKEGNDALNHLSDVAITAYSTAGLAAVLLGVPLIVVNFKRETFIRDFVKMGIGILSDNEEDLENIIMALLDRKSLLYNEMQRKNESFRIALHADEHICRVIIEACNKVKLNK